jgi:hypothetical protein
MPPQPALVIQDVAPSARIVGEYRPEHLTHRRAFRLTLRTGYVTLDVGGENNPGNDRYPCWPDLSNWMSKIQLLRSGAKFPVCRGNQNHGDNRPVRAFSDQVDEPCPVVSPVVV